MDEFGLNLRRVQVESNSGQIRVEFGLSSGPVRVEFELSLG